MGVKISKRSSYYSYNSFATKLWFKYSPLLSSQNLLIKMIKFQIYLF